MAVVTAHITWPAVPGSLGYLLEYKEQSSSVWITPTPGNPTLNLFYDLDIDEGTTYDLRISSQCASGKSKYIFTTLFDPLTPTLAWVEDSFTCEQDNPFMLVDTYTGFSSPQGIFWDQTTGLFYVVDVDDAISNIWTFDPDTITGFVSANHITGPNAPVNITSASHAFDATRRRIWIAGDDSGGARVLDMATGTYTFLPYGTDGGGGTSRRSPIVLSSSTAYCFSASPDTIETFNLTTLAPISSIPKGTIPSSATFMTQAYGVTFVGSEAWVYAGQRSDGDIAVYDSTFTTLITTITVPGKAVPGSPWTPNPGFYWQSHFYDAANNRWYISDTGSNQIIILNSTTKAVINQITITNLRGRNHASASFFKNELTGEIFAGVRCENINGDPSTNNKLYKINDSGIIYIYPDEAVALFKLRTGTNEAFGVQQNLVKWQGGVWATDGLVFKYNV